MSVNRGKQFEDVVKEAFEKLPDVSIDRLHDQTTGYLGSSNICDFIVYRFPTIFYIECKSVHGNTLSIHSNNPKNKYGNITNKQFEGLCEKSKIDGVQAGVLIWWVDKDVTKYFPIGYINKLIENGQKSIPYTNAWGTEVPGKKKRVFFDYDMEALLDDLQSR